MVNVKAYLKCRKAISVPRIFVYELLTIIVSNYIFYTYVNTLYRKEKKKPYAENCNHQSGCLVFVLSLSGSPTKKK